jgi:hypothetical protein
MGKRFVRQLQVYNLEAPLGVPTFVISLYSSLRYVSIIRT